MSMNNDSSMTNNDDDTTKEQWPSLFVVESDKCQYTTDTIVSDYTYETTVVDGNIVRPVETKMKFRTERKVPKLGVMLVGLGGNNGCTCIAGAIANKMKMTWETKEGIKNANYWGSVMLSSTAKLGNNTYDGNPVYVPISNMLPMIHPNDVVWGGWDINDLNLGDAMKRAGVLDINLQQQLYPYMKDIIPLPSIYFSDFIAANQCERANNLLNGTKQEQLDIIRQNIKDFKSMNELDKVIIVWTANTERFCSIEDGMNDTAANILDSIKNDENEISASTIFAIASILENCTFINGSPQNTFVPGVIELALQKNVFIAGDDFKSGQTKMKSVLIDFLVSAGIKPVSIVSYNHLGNNDGKNLSSPYQFRSKEISKTNVVDDMVSSNPILYNSHINEHPDHVVVIKYVPYVGDSKRAMDEYTNEIFMHGTNTIVIHNTCEDSLLATPLIYDLIILAELCERIKIKKAVSTKTRHSESNGNNGVHNGNGAIMNDHNNDSSEDGEWESFHPVLSLLSYMLKAPLVPNGAPVVNALFTQRQAIINILRACLGLAPENHMTLEHKLSSSLNEMYQTQMDHHNVSNNNHNKRQKL